MVAFIGAVALSTAYFGQAIGLINYDNVHCTGREFFLQQCNHLTQSNCDHSSDAGVRCPGKHSILGVSAAITD